MLGFVLVFACVCQEPEPAKETPPLVELRGTHVLAALPDGWVYGERDDSYSDPETTASFVVRERYDGLAKLRGILSPEALKKTGMLLIEREECRFGNWDGLLARVKLDLEGTAYDAWYAILGNSAQGVQAIAMWPSDGPEELQSSLRELISSIRWSPDPFARHPFRVTLKPGLMFAGRDGKTLFLTSDGRMTFEDPTQIRCVLAFATLKSLEERKARKQWALDRIKQTPTVRNVKIKSSKLISIDKSHCNEILASAEDEATGEPVLLYQVVIWGEIATYILNGRCLASERKTDLRLIKDCFGSFERGFDVSTLERAR